MAKNRRRFLCLDCGVDTGKIGEHYMLVDRVWFSVTDSDRGMLCVGCIEKRLGRRLNANDFNNSYVNGLGFGQIKSNRLLERLRKIAAHYGAVAQLGERFVRNEKAEGSTPFGSTIMSFDTKNFRKLISQINLSNDQSLAIIRDNHEVMRGASEYSDEEVLAMAVAEPETIRSAFRILSSIGLGAKAEQMLTELELNENHAG